MRSRQQVEMGLVAHTPDDAPHPLLPLCLDFIVQVFSCSNPRRLLKAFLFQFCKKKRRKVQTSSNSYTVPLVKNDL